ncbi:MAG: helix-turn-helix domain-containing protein [Deltaproteobacteria bacterium]|jgi:transcriptional regulator with XRE-family HTH domain|nr:helix-turn-helix domain-containing protein [Deltaproteobacteria bacterium]
MKPAQAAGAGSAKKLKPPKPPMAANVEIYPESIRKARKQLNLSAEKFALLLGVSSSSIFRYENAGIHTFHQGPLSRKLYILNSWLAQEESYKEMIRLLLLQDGFSSLAAVLEAGNALLYEDVPDTLDSVQLQNKRRTAQAGEENYYVGTIVPKLFTFKELAKKITQALNPDDPIYSDNVTGANVENLQQQADNAENMAQLAEAEARVLEAQARRIEAESRIKAAKAIIRSN